MTDNTRTVPGSRRRSAHPGERAGAPVERVGSAWRVRSAWVGREVLRARGTLQAGFLKEGSPRAERPPVLWADGEAHRRRRSLTARYFAPRIVSERYRPLIEQYAADLIADLLAAGGGLFDPYTRRFSVQVAREVIGLTDSDPDAMAGRLDRLFDHPAYDPTRVRGGRTPLTAARAVLSALAPTARFYWRDVRPAIRARRLRPREDVISHLLAEGCTDQEIVAECLTYAAAGMVTTREFLSMAAWHLLDDGALRAHYVGADERGRHAVLSEILRLEPVVRHLLRRLDEPLEVERDGEVHRFGTGEVIDLHIRDINADADAMGECPLDVHPGRAVSSGFRPEGLSFGDGVHRCPGNALALHETDAVLRRLLALDVAVVRGPRLSFDQVVHGYVLRDFDLSVRRARTADPQVG